MLCSCVLGVAQCVRHQRVCDIGAPQIGKPRSWSSVSHALNCLGVGGQRRSVMWALIRFPLRSYVFPIFLTDSSAIIHRSTVWQLALWGVYPQPQHVLALWALIIDSGMDLCGSSEPSILFQSVAQCNFRLLRIHNPSYGGKLRCKRWS